MEREGNAIVGNMLEALGKKGQLNGLKLSDFTLTTETGKDFAQFVAKDIVNVLLTKEAFVLRTGEGGPPINNTIFLRTEVGAYNQSKSDSDYIYIMVRPYFATSTGTSTSPVRNPLHYNCSEVF